MFLCSMYVSMYVCIYVLFFSNFLMDIFFTRPGWALDTLTFLCLDVPGFQGQVFKHAQKFVEPATKFAESGTVSGVITDQFLNKICSTRINS